MDERRPGGPAALLVASGPPADRRHADRHRRRVRQGLDHRPRRRAAVPQGGGRRPRPHPGPGHGEGPHHAPSAARDEVVELVETLATTAGCSPGRSSSSPTGEADPRQPQAGRPGDRVLLRRHDRGRVRRRAGQFDRGQVGDVVPVAVVIGTDGKVQAFSKAVRGRGPGGGDAVPHRREPLRAVQEPQGAQPRGRGDGPTWRPAGGCCAR